MQLAVTLLPYVAVGISLIVFLGLFYGISRVVQKLRKRLANVEALLEQTVATKLELERLKGRIEEMEMGIPASGNPLHRTSALNGTLRSKVLKMHRLGQPSERISDSLRVPKGEVDLLVRVHQIVMRPYEDGPAQSGEGQVG